MKKTDLYQSIDTIKQDKCLKKHIMQAVSEKEKAVPVKRPVFIPIMIAALICLNFGMAAKLVIFNKSQVNMSEFKARTSISSSQSTSPTDDESLQNAERKNLEKEAAQALEEKRKLLEEQLQRDQMEMNSEAVHAVMKQDEFNAAKEKFLNEFTDNQYKMVEEWTSDSLGHHEIIFPYISSVISQQNDQSQKYTFRRYVQYTSFVEGQTSSGNDLFRYAYTNHEYIVGYEGGFDIENIVSVTESIYNGDNVDMQLLESAYSKMLDNNVTDYDALESRALRIAEENYGITSVGCNVSPEVFYMFPLTNSGDADVYLNCKSEVNAAFDDNRNGGGSYSFNFILDQDGNDVTEKVSKSFDYYWGTNYINESSDYTSIPNIIGMTVNEAEAVLSEAGLSLGTRTYKENPTNSSFKPGEIISYTFDNGISTENGNLVPLGQKIDIDVCGSMMPYLRNYSLDHALEILKSNSITDYEIVYPDKEQPSDNSSYYVTESSPERGEVVGEKHVVLYVDNPDTNTIVDLLGRAVNLDASSADYLKIYSPEETKNLITSDRGTEWGMSLSDLGLDGYENTTFYGLYYGSLFYITSFKTTSKDIYAVPYLTCGLDDYTFSYSVNTDYYADKLNNLVEMQDTNGNNTSYSYTVDYNYKNNRIIATVKMENNKIKEIEASID